MPAFFPLVNSHNKTKNGNVTIHYRGEHGYIPEMFQIVDYLIDKCFLKKVNVDNISVTPPNGISKLDGIIFYNNKE